MTPALNGLLERCTKIREWPPRDHVWITRSEYREVVVEWLLLEGERSPRIFNVQRDADNIMARIEGPDSGSRLFGRRVLLLDEPPSLEGLTSRAGGVL